MQNLMFKFFSNIFPILTHLNFFFKMRWLGPKFNTLWKKISRCIVTYLGFFKVRCDIPWFFQSALFQCLGFFKVRCNNALVFSKCIVSMPWFFGYNWRTARPILDSPEILSDISRWVCLIQTIPFMFDTDYPI